MGRKTATKTKTKTERHALDSYPTPPWVVAPLLRRLHLPGGPWLEPGAGSGSLIRAVNALRDDVGWTAVEIQERHREELSALASRVVICDFLRRGIDGDPVPALAGIDVRQRPGCRFAVAFGNPPYSRAADFVHAAKIWARYVVMLLRLNFLASEERQPWLSTDAPDVYVLPNRPKFRIGSGTDSTEYAWMVWDSLRPQPRGLVQVLDLTPAELRGVRRVRRRVKRIGAETGGFETDDTGAVIVRRRS